MDKDHEKVENSKYLILGGDGNGGSEVVAVAGNGIDQLPYKLEIGMYHENPLVWMARCTNISEQGIKLVEREYNESLLQQS